MDPYAENSEMKKLHVLKSWMNFWYSTEELESFSGD
jgi:hypothetical protein